MSPERMVNMANKTIKTETNNKEGVAMKEKIIALIKGYDLYCFERDGWEGTVAEAQNNKIKKEFFEIISSLGYRMSNKDFMDIMKAVHGLDSRLTAEEVAGKIIKKEEKAMGIEEKSQSTVTAEEHMTTEQVQNSQEQVTATHQVICIDHAGYDKEFVAFKGNKSKCEEYADIHNRIDGETGIASYLVKPIDVSVGVSEADIEADNAEQIEIHELNHGVQQVQDKKAKTDKMFGTIKKYADDNKKNGFGYTISPFMLQLAILNAETGLKQLKGHTVTKEESELSGKVYKWLFDKGFIKPIVYAVKEDPNVRVYMPEYTGKTADTKVRMIPYNKSTGYTASKITSFAVNL
jgi:hypothetical protein